MSSYMVLLLSEEGELAGTRWFETAKEAEDFCEECPLDTTIYETGE